MNIQNLIFSNPAEKKKRGWVLLKVYEPSERTKKQLGVEDKYQVWINFNKGMIICDCPGFVFHGKCKHVNYWLNKKSSLN